MSEFLIQKTPIKENIKQNNINDTENDYKEKDDLDKFDIVKETLKRLHLKSKLKKNLAFILSKFYSCQISIIFISFILGFLTFGLPLFFIYNGLISNIIIPILIICVIALLFSILLIIVHFVDGKRNKVNLIEKWERKNILKNIGISITIIILIISLSFTIIFYSKTINYLEKQDIIMDSQNSPLSKELTSDFFFKYTLNMISFAPSDISESNEKNLIKFYFSEEDIINELKNKIMNLLVPLIIISFNKVIKCFLIEVKYPIEQFIFFFGAFLFCLFNIILNNFKNETIIEYNIRIISCFQNIIIGIMYIGYSGWIFHNSLIFFRNPKDKNFAIRKYNCTNISIILLFDLISFLGASSTFLSIIYFYLSITFSDENFTKLSVSFLFLKIGFLLIIIGNSYYFGHYLLSLIFRPISIQYAPYELKNEYYIKANRKLLNALKTNKKKYIQKLKDVKS